MGGNLNSTPVQQTFATKSAQQRTYFYSYSVLIFLKFRAGFRDRLSVHVLVQSRPFHVKGAALSCPRASPLGLKSKRTTESERCAEIPGIAGPCFVTAAAQHCAFPPASHCWKASLFVTSSILELVEPHPKTRHSWCLCVHGGGIAT